MYVKPRRLGSSIGVARVENDEQLREALEVAFGYDTSILAEPAQDGSIEVNCSVLGWGDDVRGIGVRAAGEQRHAQLCGQISQWRQGKGREPRRLRAG